MSDTPDYIITKRLVQRMILICLVILFSLLVAHVGLKAALNTGVLVEQLGEMT